MESGKALSVTHGGRDGRDCLLSWTTEVLGGAARAAVRLPRGWMGRDVENMEKVEPQIPQIADLGTMRLRM